MWSVTRCAVSMALACLPATAWAGGNAPPAAVANAAPAEALVGESIAFSSAGSSDPDDSPQPLSFTWDFGDGSPLSALADPSHTYAVVGSYRVTLTVSDGAAQDQVVFDVAALDPPSPTPPSRSATIAVAPDDESIAVVNPDSGSVSIVAADDLSVLEVDVGAEPRTLAWNADGTRLLVACRGSNELWVLDAAGDVLEQIPVGHHPFGVAVSPADGRVVVANEGDGSVSVLDPNDYSELASIAVEATPRAIAVLPGGATAYVTHFLSLGDVGQVSVVDLVGGDLLGVIDLAEDGGPDTDTSGRGFPGLLGAAAIEPAAQRLWIGGQKQNLSRGEYVSGEPVTPRNRIRGLLAPVDIDGQAELADLRIDPNEADSASALAFSPRGRYAYVVHQGAGTLSVYDLPAAALADTSAGAPVPIVARRDVGDAPQGIAFSHDGASVYVHNFMSRDVAVFDVSDLRDPQHVVTVPVTAEPLPADVARGKVLFFRSRDPVHSAGNYIACAGCHPDGGHDGRTWDFTQFGEGLRNTIDLRGHGGTDHGPVHWTANFNEIQDFENDIQGGFGGAGLLGGGATPHEPLSGMDNAGRSADLDALAAYVSSLDTFPPSPYREADGSLSAAALRGRDVFFAPLTGCDDCHMPPRFTDSRLTDDPSGFQRHVVGTFGPGSGPAGFLPAFDTPTVIGVWAGAPYLHNGIAATLRDMLTVHNADGLHGLTDQLSDDEIDDLVIYMLSMQGSADEIPEDPPATTSGPAETGTTTGSTTTGSRPPTTTGAPTTGSPPTTAATATGMRPPGEGSTGEADADGGAVTTDGCSCTPAPAPRPVWLLGLLALATRGRRRGGVGSRGATAGR